ncbi:MAG TPA: Hsp70 family protein, partial [Isosphaeraceae bacterium]|nr:Hsp70 family protein [Isosphaeraceae bacterium]
MSIASRGLYALATDGASDLGGKTFDEAIMAMVAEQFRLAQRYDPLQDPVVSAQLRRHAEAMKIKLAMPGQGEVRKALLLGGRAQEVLLTRGHFEQAIRPLIDRSLAVCERALRVCSQSSGGAAVKSQGRQPLIDRGEPSPPSLPRSPGGATGVTVAPAGLCQGERGAGTVPGADAPGY